MRIDAVTIPPLSNEQRLEARHAATEARRRRAQIKHGLRTGELNLADVLELAERDEVVAHTKVVDALKALPRVGVVRAEKIMARLDIAPNRRLRGLGKHQVAALIEEFGRRPGTR
jgi:GNAT superfamily N-acetyltransferase